MTEGDPQVQNLFTMTIGMLLASRSFRTIFGAVLKGGMDITIRNHGREGGVVVLSERVFRELTPGWEPDPSPPRRVRSGDVAGDGGPDVEV